MKKIFFSFIAAAMTLVACNPDVAGPSASFENAFPIMENEIGVFKLVVSNYTATEPLTIPVVFGGTAEKGTDYEVSAEAFVYGGAEPVTEITITPKVFAADKNVVLTLELPAGFTAGKYPAATFTFVDKMGYASFESASAIAVGTKNITVNVLDGNGNGLTLENGAEIAIEVDTQASTAIEGTHFQFVDNKKAAVVGAGKKKGTVSIELLSYDVNCSKLVLKIADDRFFIGDYETVEITLDSYWAKLDGRWTMSEAVTTVEELEASWSGWGFTYDGLPELNTSDALTFDIAAKKATPSFNSTYKNYFIGESNIELAGTFELNTGVGAKFDLVLVKFDNVNRYFHETEKSKDTEALVGFRIVKEEGTNNEILDMYVIDHTSKSFMPQIFEWEGYMETKPTAYMTGYYVNATFKRAN